MATSQQELERRSVTSAQVALIAGLVLLVLVAVWFFVLRDTGTDEAADVPAPVTVPTPTPEPTEEAPRADKGPVETFELFASRDPFKPLVTEAAAGNGAGTQGAVTEGSATEDGAGTTEGTATEGGGSGPGNGSESVGGHRVRLVDVFTRRGNQQAQVQVDGTVYRVAEGERFATNFELLSISGSCATMLFGDDQFTLCEGEEILK